MVFEHAMHEMEDGSMMMSDEMDSNMNMDEMEQMEEMHVTPKMINECFEHHGDDEYNEALIHCQEDICGEMGTESL